MGTGSLRMGTGNGKRKGNTLPLRNNTTPHGPSKKRPLVKCGATGCLPVIGKLSPPATTAQRLSDSVTLIVATVPQRLGWMLISATFARTPTVVASQEGKWTLTSRTLDRNESVSRVHDFLTSKFVAL
mmetsp:Transcript_21587/g.63334  ORF Transcript_21587/g.63334 Transcript_21587/m.63334 type:complete len:128 (+) Transcript_21587:2500-2883(+)